MRNILNGIKMESSDENSRYAIGKVCKITT
jgi:hypothetical protein